MQRSGRLGGGIRSLGSLVLSSRSGIFAAQPSSTKPLLIAAVCAFVLVLFDFSSIAQLAFSKQKPKFSLHNVTEAKSRLLHLLRFRNVEALRSTFRYERPHMRWKPRPVVYRGAPWRPLLGTWMQECEGRADKIALVETFYNQACPGECHGNGACDYETGQCNCRRGYNGSDCRGLDDNPCNMPSVEGFPLGLYIQSICAATCDHRMAQCFCGDATPFPRRPVVAPCGFSRHADGGLDITRVDQEQLFSTDPERPGWCMADPEKVARGEQKLERLCYNNYDGAYGDFSEVAVKAFCISQCNEPRHGACDRGFCLCKPGWYGVDCSTPSADAIEQKPFNPPPWLRALPEESLRRAPEGGVVSAVRQQKRPLIYIYNLPQKYTSGRLEGRHWKYNCATRLYDPENNTDFNPRWMYGSEIMVYEGLLSSPHRTNNAEEADYFFVPLLGACLMAEVDDNPRTALVNHARRPEEMVRPNLMADWALEVYEHIRKEYPYWDRNQGRDHIWMFLFDEGACYAPQAIWNSIMLTHWGNTEAVHRGCQSAYVGDFCHSVHQEKRGDHACYNPLKDIVIPTRKAPQFISKELRTRAYHQRPLLFYFRGNLGSAFQDGRPEDKYSMGIRQKVAKLFATVANKEGNLGEATTEGIVVETGQDGRQHYNDKLSSSRFCGVFPGDGFSARMEDSILLGCIPVIIQDGVELPFESVLDYESFALRISEKNIPRLAEILQSIPEKRVRAMLASIQSILSRFFYRSSVEITAEQQQELSGRRPAWASNYEDLTGDDALDTILQVLHYKLHHDSWRRAKDKNLKKPSGMPQHCSRA